MPPAPAKKRGRSRGGGPAPKLHAGKPPVAHEELAAVEHAQPLHSTHAPGEDLVASPAAVPPTSADCNGACDDDATSGTADLAENEDVDCGTREAAADYLARAPASVATPPPVAEPAKRECSICFCELVELWAIIPCFHATTCLRCISLVQAEETRAGGRLRPALCPTCRGPVEDLRRVYT